MAEIECRPLAQAIRAHVLSVWKECEGNQKAAAASLCISVPKLRNYLASYGIGTTTDKTKPKTPAPQRFSTDEWALLSAWADEHYPRARPVLRDLMYSCLDYFRAKGEHRADWVATFKNWVRNEAKRNPSLAVRPSSPAHKARPIEKAPPDAVQALNALLNGATGRHRMP